MPEDRALEGFISEDFLSVKFDIARFGSMVYEIVAGRKYEFYVNPEMIGTWMMASRRHTRNGRTGNDSLIQVMDL